MSKLLRGQIVGELPQAGESGQLYFLKNTDNTYTQYVADDKGILRKEKDAEGLTVDDVKGLITDNETKVGLSAFTNEGVEQISFTSNLTKVGLVVPDFNVISNPGGEVIFGLNENRIRGLVKDEETASTLTVGELHDDMSHLGKVRIVEFTNEKGEQTSFKIVEEPTMVVSIGADKSNFQSVDLNDGHFEFTRQGIKIKDSVIKGAETATTLTQTGENLVEGNGFATDYTFVNEKGENFLFSVLNKPFTYAKVGADVTEYTTEDELATIQFNQEQFAISEDKKTVQLNQSILNKLDKLTDEKIDKLLALIEKEEREADSEVGVWDVEDE